jgi:hypothetical protein
VNFFSFPAKCQHLLSKSNGFLLLIFLINLIIRGWNNDQLSLSRDEPFTLYFSQLPPSRLIPIVLETNNPPTFELMLHLWTELFGTELKTLRWLPTILISLGAIPFFKLSQRILSPAGVVLSSILYLSSNQLMNAAHLDRAYCVLIAGSLYMAYFFLLVYETKSIKYQLLWSIATIITCSAHYFGWIMVAACWFVLVAFREFRITMLRKMIVSTAIVVICYLPLGVYCLQRFLITRNEYGGTITYPDVQQFTSLLEAFSNGYVTLFVISIIGIYACISFYSQKKWNTATAFVTGSLFLLLITVGKLFEPFQINPSITLVVFSISLIAIRIAISRDKLTPSHILIICWSGVPLISGFLISSLLPIFIDRYFCFTIPSLLILVVLMADTIRNKAILWIARVAIVSAFLFNFEAVPDYTVDQRKAVEQFKTLANHSDLSIIGPGYFDFDFTYYFNSAIFFNGHYHMLDTTGQKICDDNSSVRYKEGLRRELLRNNILVANDTAGLKIDTDQIKSISLFDGNLALAYPNNGLLTYLTLRYGPPRESVDFEGIFKIYRFQK